MNYAGRQTLALNEAVKGAPIAQISYMGAPNDVAYITPYGFYSSPPVNASWVVFPLRGNDNDMVGFGNDYVNRPNDLKASDVCLFNTKSKAKIVLRTNGDIEIISTKNLSIAASTAEFNIPSTKWIGNIVHEGNLTQTGDYNLTGTGTASVDFVSAGKSGKSHTHGGVEPGAGSTGVPQ